MRVSLTYYYNIEQSMLEPGELVRRIFASLSYMLKVEKIKIRNGDSAPGMFKSKIHIDVDARKVSEHSCSALNTAIKKAIAKFDFKGIVMAEIKPEHSSANTYRMEL